MNTLVNVARYHLVDRFTWLALPWGIMAFSFLVNIGVALSVPASPDGIYTGGAGVALHLHAPVRGAEHDQVASVRADDGDQPPHLLRRHRPARCWPWAWSTASG